MERGLSSTASRFGTTILRQQDTLAAYHKRTGKDISRWYGNHFPNARAGPIEKAA